MVQALVRMFFSWRFATFIVFGGLAALVNLLVGRALYTLPGPAALLPFWTAVLIGAASGLLVNFGLNYAFNFRYRGRPAFAQLRTFAVVALGGVGLTALLASVLLGAAHWAGFAEGLTFLGWRLSTPFLSHAGATALVTFYSFAGHSLLSFNAGLRAFVVRMPDFVPSLRRAA